jgi:ribosomal protein S18 acetylase RimI-like enzyme
MIIRKATAQDLEGICAVAESVRFDPFKVQENGFLVYVHDRQSYAERIASSECFYVAIDHVELVGFLVCYLDDAVADLVSRGVMNNDVLRACVRAGCEGRWIYADQIAVRPSHTGLGIGPALVRELYKDVKDRRIDSVFVAILHEPLNTASKTFCEGLGFAFQNTLRYRDGRLWGLYTLGRGTVPRTMLRLMLDRRLEPPSSPDRRRRSCESTAMTKSFAQCHRQNQAHGT